jgi:polyhydroxyalkanoate synthesis regulator phasin
MLKELLHTGIGAGLLLKEKVEEEVKKMEDSGKIKTDDAKNFLESIEKKGKEEEEKNKEKLKSMLKEIIDDLGLATKDDLEKLKQELK